MCITSPITFQTVPVGRRGRDERGHGAGVAVVEVVLVAAVPRAAHRQARQVRLHLRVGPAAESDSGQK